jgi:hypothetical protein
VTAGAGPAFEALAQSAAVTAGPAARVPDLLTSLAAGALWCLVLAAAGSRTRAALRLPLPPGLRLPVDFLLGGWIFSFLALVLGLAGAFNRPALILLGGTLAALGRWRGHGWHWRALAPMALPTALLLPVALAPPFFYDALVYHLGLPWQALLDGRIAPHPENLFAAFPPLAQLIYAGPLAAGLDRAPALLHLGSFVAAGAAVAHLASRLGAPPAFALGAGAILPLLPAIVLVPGLPAAEGWAVAAIVLAITLALGPARPPRRGDWPRPALSGFLAGLATAARLQGLPWSVVIMAIVAFSGGAHATGSGAQAVGVPGRFATAAKRVSIATAAWFAGSAPWWLKNLLLLRDPTAPLGWHREGMESLWGAARAQMYVARGLVDSLQSVGGELLHHLSYVLPLALAAILAMLRDGRRGIRWLGGAIAAGLLLWGATGALPRFLAPALALLLALAAAASRSRLGAWAAGAALAAAAALGLAFTLRELRAWGGLRLALAGEASVQERMVVNNPLPAFAAARALPPDSRVLFVGEMRGYPFPRPFVAPSQHDVSPLREPLDRLPTAQDVRDWLLGQGYTHLLVNRAELARLASGYPVVPWRSPAGHLRFQQLLELHAPPVVKAGETAIFGIGGP